MFSTLVGAVVGDAVAKLSAAIILAMKNSFPFKSQLTKLQETISKIKPILKDMEKLNQELGGRREETEMFIRLLKEAEELVLKGEGIRWNYYKRYRHSLKLEHLNETLLSFIEINVKMCSYRDTKELLLRLKETQQRTEKSSGGGVPYLEGPVVGFENQVVILKGMLLKDSSMGDCSVVVVSAPGSCGKTTLVTMLCNDPEIQGVFGSNIYFAQISKDPNMQEVIRNLLPASPSGHRAHFSCNNDAINEWGHFLNHKNKSQVLLVLDDVWSEDVVTDFKFMFRGYKILVTSQITFKQFNTFEMLPLKDEDAIKLLCYSALPKCGFDEDNRDEIPDVLLIKLIKSCNKHPLALTVVGGLLKNARVDDWQRMFNKLSEGPRAILDLSMDQTIRLRLATCLDLSKDKDQNTSTSTSTSTSQPRNKIFNRSKNIK